LFKKVPTIVEGAVVGILGIQKFGKHEDEVGNVSEHVVTDV